MEGIPTKYNNIMFRSRLEAKWAAFFDLCGWQWEYEPVDFNGWIPDFALYGKIDLVYVEVKPVIVMPEDVCEKISRSGCAKEVLIVGQRNPFPCEDSMGVAIGWIREGFYGHNYDGLDDYEWWQEAAYGRWAAGNGTIGFCPSMGVYVDRITGTYDGGHFGDYGIDENELKQMWAEAQNRTQWKPRGK